MTWTFSSLHSLVPAAVVLLSVGCAHSYITAPHQPYAPLLDHAGQMDVSVRAGGITTNDMTLAVQAAYAPVDHFTIAAAFDGDLDRTGGTFHAGGGLAVGTFTRTDVLRLEAFVGFNLGHAEGYGVQCEQEDDPIASCMTERFTLSGFYTQPFTQVAIGFELPFFELAGGARLEAQFTDVSGVGDLGTRTSSMHERVLLSPFLTVRVPIDVIRFEFMTGVPFTINGNEGPLPGTWEPAAYWYIVGGIGFQFDLLDSGPVEEGPHYAPPAVYPPPPAGHVY